MVPGPRSGWLAQSTRSLSRLRDRSIKFRQARARLGPHARLWARRSLAPLQEGHESVPVTECDPAGGRRGGRIEAKGESGRTHRGGRGAAIAGNSVGVGARLVWAAACVWSRALTVPLLDLSTALCWLPSSVPNQRPHGDLHRLAST